MAILDTDYASEAQTCGLDTDGLDSTIDRRVKAGLGQSAKKVIGLDWRSPDVSQGYHFFGTSSLTCLSSTSPSFAL
jgi:hypothetical protein